MFSTLVSCLAATSLIVATEESNHAMLYQPFDHPERRSRPTVAWVERQEDDDHDFGLLRMRSSRRDPDNLPSQDQRPTSPEFLPLRNIKEEWKRKLWGMEAAESARPYFRPLR